MPHNKVFKKEGISQNNNLHIIYKVLFTSHLQVSMSEKKNHAVFPSSFGSVLSIDQFESSDCWHRFAPVNFWMHMTKTHYFNNNSNNSS
jgi:hypothetical protein